MEVFSPRPHGIVGVLQGLADQLSYRLPADPFDRSAYLEACDQQDVDPVPDQLLLRYWMPYFREQAIRSESIPLITAVLLADGRAAQLAQAQMLGRLPIDPLQGLPRQDRLEALSASHVPWLSELSGQLLARESANV